VRDRTRNNGFARAVLGRVVAVGLLTLALAVPIGLLSTGSARALAPVLGLVVLLVVISIGVIFDVIGIAIAVGDEKPFHALAAKRIGGAAQAIRLIRHADKVSAFTNDVIGDIAGTVSGGVAAAIVAQMTSSAGFALSPLFTGLLVSFAAALTAGGKAGGKKVALTYSFHLVFMAGRAAAWIDRTLGLNVLRVLDWGGYGRRGSGRARRKPGRSARPRAANNSRAAQRPSHDKGDT
jgi:hypothetical protein